jgi:hypothetical protein
VSLCCTTIRSLLLWCHSRSMSTGFPFPFSGKWKTRLDKGLRVAGLELEPSVEKGGL